MIWTLALLVGCASSPAGPYQAERPAGRDTQLAQSLSQEAASCLDEDPERAEKLLREALTADLFFGPAHNNLGVVFLEAGKLYEAAQEFEWARKLMPGRPEPRVNLAMTLEKAGQTEEALASYHAALSVTPEFLPSIQGIARLEVGRGEGLDEQTAGYLRRIRLESEDPAWRGWAEEALLKSGQ